MTNEFVKNRLLKYRDCLENKVLGETNYSRLIKLLKQDLYELKKIKTQNKYTKISFADCEKYINHKNVDFRAIANTLFLVFFDYYIVNITEPIQDEIFELMTEFVNCFLNRSMTYSQLTVHNLRSVTLLNSQNHQDGYYHSLYQKLLADDDIYQISEIVHDELFRQYCNALCRILILNNKFEYLIDFYNKVNRTKSINRIFY